MRFSTLCLPVLAMVIATAQASTFAQTETHPDEHLGTVSFAVSCTPAVQPSFNRGVALLHDFWYAEADAQFHRIAVADPSCAMAHWGLAMSLFHQIWNRPGDHAMQVGWEEMQKAESLSPKTEREREYIAALSSFYKPGPQDFMARVTAYSAAMGALYKQFPDDVDAGAFYALSLLASKAPNDTGLTHDRQALSILTPLYARYPDNPGLDHYIVHSCDNPAMAADGLKAADHYLLIAPSGPHAAHMPGHIYARLGLWQKDIDSQLASIHASEVAETNHESGLMDKPHSFDFLAYAYLQSGQDAAALKLQQKMRSVLSSIDSMPGMAATHRPGMSAYYLSEFPAVYAIEMRDWQAAAALQVVADAPPDIAQETWWARAIADGHLHHATAARLDRKNYDALTEKIRKGKDSFLADSTGAQIAREEVVAWTSFAQKQNDEALQHMQAAADLQDKVGQGEVDIPAREMLGDMLLELHRPQDALAAYRIALKLSPNRFNGLYHAGLAAEQSGDKAAAGQYFAQLLKSTQDGASSARPELATARTFLSSQTAASTGNGGK